MNYESNSTNDEFSSLHSWSAKGFQTDVYGTHFQFDSYYSKSITNATGSFAEFMNEHTHDMYIQWDEFHGRSNGSWTLQIDFVLGSFYVETRMIISGANHTVKELDTFITDGRLQDSEQKELNNSGIFGLDITADISLTILKECLQAFLVKFNKDSVVRYDLQFTNRNVYFGTIPDEL